MEGGTPRSMRGRFLSMGLSRLGWVSVVLGAVFATTTHVMREKMFFAAQVMVLPHNVWEEGGSIACNSHLRLQASKDVGQNLQSVLVKVIRVLS